MSGDFNLLAYVVDPAAILASSHYLRITGAKVLRREFARIFLHAVSAIFWHFRNYLMFSSAVLSHNRSCWPHHFGAALLIKVRPHAMLETLTAYTILIVEDNEDVRSIFAEVFEDEGYRVRQAANGAEAFGVMDTADGSVDVVLTDLRMQLMNGAEFASKLKHDPRFEHIPVVLLTATPVKDSWQARELFGLPPA
ncbi:response regulator [Herbaspirillum seropedicae]|uniref:response regulator n=1 Tax=Herbaspirillum seropedicae TaxID=964 RepID=UPI003F8D6344